MPEKAATSHCKGLARLTEAGSSCAGAQESSKQNWLELHRRSNQHESQHKDDVQRTLCGALTAGVWNENAVNSPKAQSKHLKT